MKTGGGGALRRRVIGAVVALRLIAAMAWAAPPSALPGAPPLDEALREKLSAAAAASGAEPRTRHRNADGSPKYVNRLVLEDSPYLRQHAYNPVNWYPWGGEVFERAKAEGKPVLLSIGYSTCHWCHVMEEESFEDEEIAGVLNREYVAVKVDRERRPDVDGVYMAAVHALTGGGGWPMTVWLTPDRKPFYGGTYFPPRDGDRGVAVGFAHLLTAVAEAYRKEPGRAAAAADEVVRGIEEALAPHGSALSSAKLAAAVEAGAKTYFDRFDEANGGFGAAPKFPQSLALELLLREARRKGDRRFRDVVATSLERMAEGGVYDQVGGGFHRYSTDRAWRVPHFEKMLYDNALLTVAYLEGYQATGREDFARVAQGILRYVGREMTAPEGGFYSATDADSDGVEGKFFLWTRAEVGKVLGAERARWFAARYGITEKGARDGGSVLRVSESLPAIAKRSGKSEEELGRMLEGAREELYLARAKREPPFRDTKILTSWNGLMISAYARAAETLGEKDYANRAVAAATFVLGKMKSGDGLRRSYFEGRAEGTAYLDDYAFLEQGLLDLHEATFDPRWLREAIALQKALDAHYPDPAGGYFRAPDGGEKMVVREKPGIDSAEPSGNSVAVLNNLRLAELTADDGYRKRAEETLAAFGTAMTESPAGFAKMLSAAGFLLDSPKEIVLVKPDAEISAEPMLEKLRQVFLPNRVVIVASQGKDLEAQKQLVPLLQERAAIGGKVTAYVCERRLCKLPTTDPETFARQIVDRDGNLH